MKIRENCKYALVVPTSMGVRITPPNGQPVASSNMFMMQATSAETNVASISAYLGLPTKVLTTFVKDSPIADFIKRDLRSRGMDYEGKEVEQGDPWGYRHQFNIADSGYGSRGPRVCNDRAGEVGRTLNIKDFDLDRIFGEEGVGILHLSGLIGALSPETTACCVAVAKKAKEYGTLISFDLNYRASFWKGREQELHDIFTEIASVADILIGNEGSDNKSGSLVLSEGIGKGLSYKTDAVKLREPDVCNNDVGMVSCNALEGFLAVCGFINVSVTCTEQCFAQVFSAFGIFVCYKYFDLLHD